MEYDDVVMGRRSIRGFKTDPVPKDLIREVIGMAMRAPSSLNTQPWNFHVVAGDALDRIRAGNTERNLAGVPHSREFRMHGKHMLRTACAARNPRSHDLSVASLWTATWPCGVFHAETARYRNRVAQNIQSTSVRAFKSGQGPRHT